MNILKRKTTKKIVNQYKKNRKVIFIRIKMKIKILKKFKKII